MWSGPLATELNQRSMTTASVSNQSIKCSHSDKPTIRQTELDTMVNIKYDNNDILQYP